MVSDRARPVLGWCGCRSARPSGSQLSQLPNTDCLHGRHFIIISSYQSNNMLRRPNNDYFNFQLNLKSFCVGRWTMMNQSPSWKCQADSLLLISTNVSCLWSFGQNVLTINTAARASYCKLFTPRPTPHQASSWETVLKFIHANILVLCRSSTLLPGCVFCIYVQCLDLGRNFSIKIWKEIVTVWSLGLPHVSYLQHVQSN